MTTTPDTSEIVPQQRQLLEDVVAIGRVCGTGNPEAIQWALDEIDRLRAEVANLRRWKAEAAFVLKAWDEAFDAARIEGALGSLKWTAMSDEIERLRAALDDQHAEIARHHRDFERWEAMADKGAARIAENELLQRIVDCLDPPCFLRVPAGGTLHDPHGQEIYWADGEEDELLLLAKPLVLNLFDEWGRSSASAAPASANPYRHDHNPLNADIHGGICSACEWERDEAAASSASEVQS